MKKIAHFGAFDHDSYGDLLFPKLLEKFLPEFSITAVAPTGIPTTWSDASPIIGVDEALGRTDWDGIIVGGGDIIQAGEWGANKWRAGQSVPFSGLPALWAGAAFLAAKLNIPAVWSTPGVPLALPDWFSSCARQSFECLDYISVRDATSRDHILPFTQADIEVMPDLSIVLPRLWPEVGKRSRLVLALSKIDMEIRTSDINHVIQTSRQSCEFREHEILVAPLMGWEFEGTSQVQTLRDSSINARLATECKSLESLARLIGGSSGYIGNSLHGLITAIAYGVPAVLVVPYHNQVGHKYRGFLEAVGLDADSYLADNWKKAYDLFIQQKPVDIAAAVFSQVDRHLDKMRTLLDSGGRDKTQVWAQITLKVKQDSENLLLHGVPPEQLCFLAGEAERNLAVRTDQLGDPNKEMFLVKARERIRTVFIQARRLSILKKSAQVANACLQRACIPIRALRYLCDSSLRFKLLNNLERRFLPYLKPRKISELPHLDWLLGRLQIDVSPAQILPQLGSYLTRREEARYREMIEPLRRADNGVPSTVSRPADLVPAIEENGKRRRILFVCGEFPDPVHGGGGRVADFIKALSSRHDVFLAAWYERGRDGQALAEISPYCRGVKKLSFEDLEGGCSGKLLRFLGGEPVDIVHYEWPRSLKSFDRRLGRHHLYTHMEVVSCSLWMDLQRMEPLSPGWMQRLAQIFTMIRLECLEASCADAQIVVTAKDGRFLSRFVSGQNFAIVNHGINRAEFDIPERPAARNTLVFTGNFTHYPNVDATHFFMKEIRPLILARVPDMTVWLVGANPPASILAYRDEKKVFVTGHVADIRSYIQKATVCIAPLISGAGLRTKVVQYAALRRPCVATSIAAEDLEFEDGREILIADDPERFSAQVIKLLLDPELAATVAEAAHRRAIESYENNRIAEQALGGLYRRMDEAKGVV